MRDTPTRSVLVLGLGGGVAMDGAGVAESGKGGERGEGCSGAGGVVSG